MPISLPPSHSQLCIHQRACTSTDERTCYEGTWLWFTADGCVIIRGILSLSFAAATLPSRGRGASPGVHQPTAVPFQVHFHGKCVAIGLNQTVLYLHRKWPIKKICLWYGYVMPELISLLIFPQERKFKTCAVFVHTFVHCVHLSIHFCTYLHIYIKCKYVFFHIYLTNKIHQLDFLMAD